MFCILLDFALCCVPRTCAAVLVLRLRTITNYRVVTIATRTFVVAVEVPDVGPAIVTNDVDNC